MDYGPAVGEPVVGRAWSHSIGFVNGSVGPQPLRVRHGAGPRSPERSAGWRGQQRMTTTNDQHWLELARSGDRAAFGRLIRQHQPRIHRLALHLTGNAGEADDVVQETFLRAYRAIGRFDGRADLFTWLYRI